MVASALLLLPDFLLIALGAGLRRVRIFEAPFWRGLERFVYFVLFPALLFRALATATMALGDASRLVIVGVLFTLAGMGLSALARPLLRLPQPTFAACFQCAFRFNTYIALAAASRLAGAEGVAALSLLIGVLVPIVNVAAVAVLARDRGRRGVWLAIARNPLVIACAGTSRERRAAARPDRGRCRPRIRPRYASASRGGLVERDQAGVAAGDRVRARERIRIVDARAPDGSAARRRADGTIVLHTRDADERQRGAGRAVDLQRNADRDRHAAPVARAGDLSSSRQRRPVGQRR